MKFNNGNPSGQRLGYVLDRYFIPVGLYITMFKLQDHFSANIPLNSGAQATAAPDISGQRSASGS